MRVIAGLFDRGHSSVQRILSETGGIRPRQRRRSHCRILGNDEPIISLIQTTRLVRLLLTANKLRQHYKWILSLT